jgi:hypothetical protein
MCRKAAGTGAIPSLPAGEGIGRLGAMRTPNLPLCVALLLLAGCEVEEEVLARSPPVSPDIDCIEERADSAALVISEEEDCAYFVAFGESEDGSPGAGLAATTRRTVFLNRWGGTYEPGRNNSSEGRSSLVQQTTGIPPFPGSDESWLEVAQCVRERFARFDVEITEDDPGARPHIEAVVGGHPCQLGLGDRVRGVAPLAGNCSVVERAVVYTFAHNIEVGDPLMACDVTVHEIGHALGLDHEYLCDDPMTYLSCGHRSFQDVDASCGTTEPRACACGERQNSAKHLYGVLGQNPDGDREAPEVEVLSPAAGEERPGDRELVIEARAWDNDEVAAVKLLWQQDATYTIDCARPTAGVECSRDNDTYRFSLRTGTGVRSFRVLAVDREGNTTSTPSQQVVLLRDLDSPTLPMASER